MTFLADVMTAPAGAALGLGFLTFVVLLVGCLGFVLWRCLSRRDALIGIAGLLTWLAYACIVGASGVLQNTSARPPGMLLLVGPVLIGLVAVLWFAGYGRKLAEQVPLEMLVRLQLFRIGVELVLHLLWRAGKIPHLMTLAGGNMELLFVLTVPFMERLGRQPRHHRFFLIWNLAGILSLLNIVVRSALTAPGPLNLIHAEVPNVAIGMYPYNLIPGFLVPLALVLHGVSMTAVRIKTMTRNT